MSGALSMDRRRFLGQVALSLGGIALSGVAPASLLQAAPVYWDACGDWHVDDMCGAYPPYAFNTGASQPHTVPMPDAGADRYWVM